MKFRKRPVEVEAFRLSQTEDFADWVLEAVAKGRATVEEKYLTIHTLEGDMRAEDGDWIIKGVRGEIYPCKADIFAETYEPVTEKVLA